MWTKGYFNLGVTILLSLTIFLNTVSAIIPITSDSPLVGKIIWAIAKT